MDHLAFGWAWITVGLLAGAALGLRFHEDQWLGGYASWRRRMLRLGHIACLGTGLLNCGFAVTPSDGAGAAAWLFPLGAVAMPLVCALAAWRRQLRHLFALPVLALLGGCVDLLLHLQPVRP
jgi:hypothetical protein